MTAYNALAPANDYRLTMSSGEVIEVTTSVANTLAFEREFRRPLAPQAGSVPLTTDLLWLAWHQACREQKTQLRQFALFQAQVANIEIRTPERASSIFDDDDLTDGADRIAGFVGADPTQPAATGV